MKLMAPTDSVFLIPESKEQPMHVGGLQVFDLPPDAGKGWLRELYERALADTDLAPTFRKRPHRSLATLGQWAWVTEDDIDLEHHVRHSALPEPGRVRELLALVSRLHSTQLSYDRPLWESHLIEGLEGNRFAVYTKVHHALMDGISASRLLQRSLSTDPDARAQPMPWSSAYSVRAGGGGGDAGGPSLFGLPKALAGMAVGATTDVVGLAPRVLKIAAEGLRNQASVLPLQAPRSPLNVSITGSRRFAADGWPIQRMRAVAKAGGATINDIVLAMVASALRDYFSELDTLPGSAMVAMTPMSLRGKDDEAGGNAVGAILCSLATDVADPVERLTAISASMKAGKGALSGLSQLQVSALSAVVMAPVLVNYLTGLHSYSRPAFNLVVSNVPGPPKTLYWNGARLSGSYPLSIPLNGQALNVTVTSYDGEMQFGLIGCRRTLPSLQKLLTGLEDGLAALEAALLPLEKTAPTDTPAPKATPKGTAMPKALTTKTATAATNAEATV